MALRGLTPSELQRWGSSLKGWALETQAGTELSDIRVGAGVGAAFSQRKSAAIVLLMRPSLTDPVGTMSENPSTWLTLFTQPR